MMASHLPAMFGLAGIVLCACTPPTGPLDFSATGRVTEPAISQPMPVARDQRQLGGPLRANTAESTGTGAELAFVTDILADLQLRSFAANAEFCGYLGVDQTGALATSTINRGDEASCTMPAAPPGLILLASFHTHGTYSPRYASELPTAQDMLTDAQDGIDGYISTPGGRLWYVDTDTMTVRELCSRACLPQDPRYVAADDGPVVPFYTLAMLQSQERG